LAGGSRVDGVDFYDANAFYLELHGSHYVFGEGFKDGSSGLEAGEGAFELVCCGWPFEDGYCGFFGGLEIFFCSFNE
jgi:hypothetical protein